LLASLVNRTLAGQIYELAWPVLIAQLAVMAYAVIDSAMAGRYATDDLAAVGIGASIYFSVFVALMGVLLAVTPTVAQLLGAGRHAEIGEQIRQAMWLVLALAVLSVWAWNRLDFFQTSRLVMASDGQTVRMQQAWAAYRS